MNLMWIRLDFLRALVTWSNLIGSTPTNLFSRTRGHSTQEAMLISILQNKTGQKTWYGTESLVLSSSATQVGFKLPRVFGKVIGKPTQVVLRLKRKDHLS